MADIKENGKHEGIAIGLKTGREQGLQSAKKEIAKKLFILNYTIEYYGNNGVI